MAYCTYGIVIWSNTQLTQTQDFATYKHKAEVMNVLKLDFDSGTSGQGLKIRWKQDPPIMSADTGLLWEGIKYSNRLFSSRPWPPGQLPFWDWWSFILPRVLIIIISVTFTVATSSSPQRLFGRLNLQHCRSLKQKTLLFRLSLRPGINYRLWVLENGKHPQEINLPKLSQSPNSRAVDGWGRMSEPHQIEKSSKKALRQPLPSFPRLCVPALTEGLIWKVHFTNGCVSRRDQFFLLCDCWITPRLRVKESARDAFVWDELGNCCGSDQLSG